MSEAGFALGTGVALLGREWLIDRVVKTWTGELVDLTGRSTLLYYRDLKQGTLDLGTGAGVRSVPVDALLSSRRVHLSELFAEDVLASVARRARTVKAKATENFEERGKVFTAAVRAMAGTDRQEEDLEESVDVEVDET